MGKKFAGTAYYYMSSWYHMKQYCKEQYPDGSPFSHSTVLFYDHCALAHTNIKGNPETTNIEAIYDYADIEWSINYKIYQNNLCDLIMAIGVICYIAGYSFNQRAVLVFCFVMNILMGLHTLVIE
jgi:hypothetical protein